jgi:uncharacterized protein (TIGR03067 family)
MALDDAQALLGVWRASTGKDDGKDVAPDDVKNLTLMFEKNIVTVRYKDEVRLQGTFKLDPSAKPRGIDVTVTEDAKGKETPKMMFGVYALSKDSLRWCVAKPDAKQRPKALDTKKGDGQTLLTLKREKP